MNSLNHQPGATASGWDAAAVAMVTVPRSGDLAGPKITVTPNQARAARAAACHPAVGIQRIAIFHGAPVHICIPSPGFPSPCPPSHPFLAGSAPAVS